MTKWLLTYESNGRYHFELYEFLTTAEFKRAILELEGIKSIIELV